jgi:signal transduction histidine kinase
MAMQASRRLKRLPIESNRPLVLFAASRVAIALLGLIAVVALGFPYEGRATAVVGGLLLPWTVLGLVLARRRPDAALHPAVVAGDFACLVVLEVVVPETLGAVRVIALYLIACHAHFQGEGRGIVLGLGAALTLVLASLLRGDEPVSGAVFAFYETVFVLTAVATSVVVSSLRTAESASRLQARRLSRRTLQAESDVRRRLAASLHDGPVQELIGLDMILSAARAAAENGHADEARKLLDEARELATRTITTLRDEIVDLGPYAFEELSFEAALQRCLDVWKRRYGFDVLLTIERLDLPPDTAGALFRIAQEAVINAGRHSEADTVSISLRSLGPLVELRVTDDGRGFEANDPMALSEPGHLGLAGMRERAALLGGQLDIESSGRGTRVLVSTPLRPADNGR